jgi:hypothetical protein
MADYPTGWALPVMGVGAGPNAKAHYYSAGFAGSSLCGRYTMLGGQREDFHHDSPDNCAECRRRLAKERPDLNISVAAKRVRVEVVESVKDDGWWMYSAGQRAWFEGTEEELAERIAKGEQVSVKFYASKHGSVKGKGELSADNVRRV